jgi:hypothetical protein
LWFVDASRRSDHLLPFDPLKPQYGREAVENFKLTGFELALFNSWSLPFTQQPHIGGDIPALTRSLRRLGRSDLPDVKAERLETQKSGINTRVQWWWNERTLLNLRSVTNWRIASGLSTTGFTRRISLSLKYFDSVTRDSTGSHLPPLFSPGNSGLSFQSLRG